MSTSVSQPFYLVPDNLFPTQESEDPARTFIIEIGSEHIRSRVNVALEGKQNMRMKNWTKK